MFEKEAKKSFMCKKVLYKWETDKRSYIGGFQDGAEFGYNKATEWHYPSKGEYPKTKKKVLVQLKDVDEPILDYYRQDGLWNYALKEEVIAWKEIVLPNESE